MRISIGYQTLLFVSFCELFVLCKKEMTDPAYATAVSPIANQTAKLGVCMLLKLFYETDLHA